MSGYEKMSSEGDHELYASTSGLGGVRYESDSFGTIVVSQSNCTPSVKCFGSELLHNQYIDITINTAYLLRRSDVDYISSEDRIVSFRMTKNQWCDMVSSIGKGAGTPITLQIVPEYNKLKRCESPNVPNRLEISSSIKESEYKVLADRIEEISNVISKSRLNSSEKDAINRDLLKLHQMLGVNYDYYVDNLRNVMDDVVSDAKRSLEVYANEIGINRDTLPSIGVD